MNGISKNLPTAPYSVKSQGTNESGRASQKPIVNVDRLQNMDMSNIASLISSEGDEDGINKNINLILI